MAWGKNRKEAEPTVANFPRLGGGGARNRKIQTGGRRRPSNQAENPFHFQPKCLPANSVALFANFKIDTRFVGEFLSARTDIIWNILLNFSAKWTWKTHWRVAKNTSRCWCQFVAKFPMKAPEIHRFRWKSFRSDFPHQQLPQTFEWRTFPNW